MCRETAEKVTGPRRSLAPATADQLEPEIVFKPRFNNLEAPFRAIDKPACEVQVEFNVRSLGEDVINLLRVTELDKAL